MDKQISLILNLISDLLHGDDRKKAMAAKGLEMAELLMPSAYKSAMDMIASEVEVLAA